MKRRNQDLLLGVTAIFMLTLFMGTFLFLYNTMPADVRPIEVHFPHRDGMVPLAIGGPVLLSNAVNVGRVTEVKVQTLDAAQGADTYIVVKAMVIDSLRIYKDAKINTNQPAVGGNGYLNIQSLGTARAGVVEPGEAIMGSPPESFAAAVSGLSARILAEGGLMDQIEGMLDPESDRSLVYKLATSLDDVNAITAQLKLQLSPTERDALMSKIHLAVDNIAQTTRNLRLELSSQDSSTAMGKVHVALDQLTASLTTARDILQENQPRVANTLKNVEQATETINRDIVGSLKHEFDANDPASLLGKIRETVDGVNFAIADVQTTMASAKRMVVLNEPLLASIFRNVSEMSDQLRRGAEELRLNPSKLIWGPGGAGQRQNAAFTAARDFAEAAEAMNQAAGRLRALVEAAPRSRDSAALQQQARALQAELDASMQRLQRAERFFYDQIGGR